MGWSEGQAHETERPAGHQTMPGRSQRNHSSDEAGQLPWSEGFQEDGCRMTKLTEATSATVPQAQQAEEILSRWRWVEPCAWTIRMLTALEQGVKGTKWFRLFDKVFAERNLWAAFQQVAQNGGAPGVDHVTVKAFEERLPDSIWELSDALKTGQFTPPGHPTGSHSQARHERDPTAGYSHGAGSRGAGCDCERDRTDL